MDKWDLYTQKAQAQQQAAQQKAAQQAASAPAVQTAAAAALQSRLANSGSGAVSRAAETVKSQSGSFYVDYQARRQQTQQQANSIQTQSRSSAGTPAVQTAAAAALQSRIANSGSGAVSRASETVKSQSGIFYEDYQARRQQTQQQANSTQTQSYRKSTYTKQAEKLYAEAEQRRFNASVLSETATRARYRAEQDAMYAAQKERELKNTAAVMQQLYTNYQKKQTNRNTIQYSNAWNRYQQQIKEIDSLNQSALAAQNEYAQAGEQAQQAYSEYESYMQEQGRQYQQWRDSIRPSYMVQSDLYNVRNEKTRLQTEKQNALREAGQRNDFALAAQLREKYDAQISALSEQETLIFEELQQSQNKTYEDLQQNTNFARLSNAAEDEGNVLWAVINKGLDTSGAGNIAGQAIYQRARYMNEEEKRTYNYLYNTDGAEAAERYVRFIADNGADGLTARRGQDIADNTSGLGTVGLAAQAGFDRFGAGLRQWTTGEAVAPSELQYASSAKRGTLSAAQGFGYDLVTNATNMAPSILASAAVTALTGGAGAGVGTALMGASAAGNAYSEQVRQGRDPREAEQYALLIGASEAGLQYVLGGITKLGGAGNAVAEKVLSKLTALEKNAFTRVATKLVSSGISEGVEEGLQEILEPVFSTMIFNEDYSPAEFSEVAYAFLLGAASSGLIEAGDVVTADIATGRQGKAAISDGMTEQLIDSGLAAGEGTAQYRAAQLLKNQYDAGKKLSAYQVGELYGQAQRGELALQYDGAYQQQAREQAQQQAQAQPLTEEQQSVVRDAGRVRAGESLQGENAAAAAQTGNATQLTSENEGATGEQGARLAEQDSELQQMRRAIESSGIEKSDQMLRDGALTLGDYREVVQTIYQMEQSEKAARQSEPAQKGEVYKVAAEVQFKTAEDKAFAQKMSSIIGRDIVAYSRPTNADGSVQNGFYNRQDGRIYVNVNSDKVVPSIVGHEITHAIESDDVLYKQLVKIAENTLNKSYEGGYDAYFEQTKQTYRQGNVNISDADVAKETVANFVMDYVLTDEASFDKMTDSFNRQNLGLWSAIGYRLSNLAKRIGAVFSKKMRQTYNIEQARDRIANALYNTRGNAQQMAGQSDALAMVEALKGQLAAGEITDAEFAAAVDPYLAEAGAYDNNGRGMVTAQPAAAYSISRGTTEGTETAVQTAEISPEERKAGAAVEQLSRLNLPTKALDAVKRQERIFSKRLRDAFGYDYATQKEVNENVLKNITDEFLAQGYISQQTLDDSFDFLWDNGVKRDEQMYHQYAELRQHLRENAFSIDAQDANDIPDFKTFVKRYRGRLRVTKDGMRIDEYWQQLAEMWPEFFSAEVSAPSDQLLHIAEVSDSLRKTETNYNMMQNGEREQAQEWMRNDFEHAASDYAAAMTEARRYAEDRARGKADGNIAEMTTEQAEKLYQQMREQRIDIEKVSAKVMLRESDRRKVDMLLRGDITERSLNPARDNVGSILKMVEAKRDYADICRQLDNWKKAKRTERLQKADSLIHGIDQWKDKKTGMQYKTETMERNFQDIIGYDTAQKRAQADAINNEYTFKVKERVAQRTRALQGYVERVKALHISDKVKNGEKFSESAAVQLWGEAQYHLGAMQENPRLNRSGGYTMGEWNAMVNNMFQSSPSLVEQKAKIQAAIDEFRTIYDELIAKMNETRVRNGYEPVPYRKGYFPHFREETADTLLAKIGISLGITSRADALPTTINGMTANFKPGIRWMGNALERQGFKTDYDALAGMGRYLETAGDVIYLTDSIQDFRALEQAIRRKTSDETVREEIDQIRNDDRLTDEEQQAQIDALQQNRKYALSNLVVELNNYANILAGKKTEFDRGFEQLIGRRGYTMMRKLESRVGANMVSANLSSALTQYIPLTQAIGAVGPNKLLRGMAQTMIEMNQNRANGGKTGLYEASDFLTNRRGYDRIGQTLGSKVSEVLSTPMQMIDDFVSESIVRARMLDNQTRGMNESEALIEADRFASGLMADRSKGAMPTFFYEMNPVSKLFSQFQLEVNNQLRFIAKDMPRMMDSKKFAFGLFKMAICAWLFDDLFEKITGRKPALDVISIANDFAGDATGYKLPNTIDAVYQLIATGGVDFTAENGKKNAWQTVSNAAGNAAEQLPFVGGLLGGGRMPISSALPDVAKIGQVALGDASSGYKAEQIGKELAKPGYYVAMPFAGGQLKKTIEGIGYNATGGEYVTDPKTGEKQLRYAKPEGAAGVVSGVQAVTVGKTGTISGLQWIGSDFSSLSAKQTAGYEGAVQAGMRRQDAEALLKQIKNASGTDELSASKQKLNVLLEADIPEAARDAIFRETLAADGDKYKLASIKSYGLASRELLQLKADTTDYLKQANAEFNADAENAEWVEKHTKEGKTENKYTALNAEMAGEVIGAMNLTTEQKAALWQTVNKAWSAANNPFDTRVSAIVKNRLEQQSEVLRPEAMGEG